MQIKKFTIIHNNQSETIPFKRITFLKSTDNSKGKTTLIRSLLYSLGFEMPNTQYVNFNHFSYKIDIESNGKDIFVERSNSRIAINDNEFSLPAQSALVCSSLFNADDKRVAENLLCTFFIDQDDGWTIINKGSIVGGNTFNLFELLNGLGNVNDLAIRDEIEKLNYQISKHEFILKSYDKQKEIQKREGKETRTSDDMTVNLNRKMASVSEKIAHIDSKISKINEAINENTAFSSFINKMHLSIETDSGDVIPINEKNLTGYTDYQDILKERREMLFSLKSNLIIERNNLSARIQEISKRNNIDEIIESYFSSIGELDVAKLTGIAEDLKTKRSLLEKKVISMSEKDNKWINRFWIYARKFAKEMDIPNQYLNTNKLLLMKRNRTVSGADLHKLSLCFRLSAIKTCEDRLGFKFFIILDSPGGREVKDETIISMFNVINKHFSENQIIIATINDYSNIFPKDETIVHPVNKQYFNEGILFNK